MFDRLIKLTIASAVALALLASILVRVHAA